MFFFKQLCRAVIKSLWHGVKHILEFCGWDYGRIFQIRRGVHLIVFQTDLIPQNLPPSPQSAPGRKKEMWPLSDFSTVTGIYKEL